jgi:hypothetical protein
MRNLYTILFFYVAAMRGQDMPTFQPLRYNEDYSSLASDTIRTGYSKMKYLPLSSNVFASFGGDLRYQYLYLHNEDWNAINLDNDGFVMTRLLFHSDLHWGKRIRIYAEIQSSMASSREVDIPVEDNPLELHQLFTDFGLLENGAVTIRVGRQEMLYGSQRLLSVRDFPNDRRAFDGVKGIIKLKNRGIDVFYMNYVQAQLGIMNDKSSPDVRLWGTYFTSKKSSKQVKPDFYYLGVYKKNVGFNAAHGSETRHTIGTRLYKTTGNLKFDVESVYQWGTFSGQNISAWSAAFEASYLVEGLIFTPEVGVKADAISGDRSKNDHSLQTLNPLFPTGAYFGQAAKIGPSNLLDIHPTLLLHLSKSVKLFCDYAFLWRYSKGDGIYMPNMIEYYEDKTSTSRNIGSQISASTIIIPNKFFSFVFGMSYFKSGKFIRDMGSDKDIFLSFASLQYKF